MISLSREAFVIILLCLCSEFSKGVTDFQNLLAIWRQYSGQLQDGNSSYYDYYQGGGACSLDPPSKAYAQTGARAQALGTVTKSKRGKDSQRKESDTNFVISNLFITTAISDKQSSYYGYYQGGGACSLDPLTTDYSHRGWIKVAAGDGEFQKSLGCGMCVEIKGQGILAELAGREKIPKTPIIGPIYAVIIDRCGNCKQGFDLYAPGTDIWKTQFRAVDCPRASGVNGNIKFRFLESNPWAMKLQTRNSRVATVGLEIFHNGRWVCLPRSEDNYFLMGSPNRINFPLRVRLTSVSGEQVESTISEIKNNVDITSSVQFSGFIKGSDPRTIKCYGQGPARGTEDNDQTADESFCKGKLDGSYEDPRNCAAYYQCFRFSTIRRRCPRGQVFNGFVKACDSRENFPCRQRTFVSVPSPSRERVTSKVVISQTQHRLETNDDSSSTTKVDTAFCHGKFDGFYDDPNDCQAFYQCLKGRPTKRFCLKGMLFNPMLKTCDTPHNFPCRLTEEVGTVALETESPAVNHDHRPLERNDEGQNLTHSTSDTATRTGNNPTTSVNTVKPAVKSDSNTNDHIVDKHFCLDRANGNYADPYDCSSFYTCTKGDTLKQSCPKALRYNYKTGECDWPSNVKCIKQPLFKAWIHNVRTGASPDDQGLTIHGSITRVTAVARKHIIHKPDNEIIIINENDN